MFLGIKIPKFFGRRKKRIMELLEEGENLSIEELKKEAEILKLFNYFSEFLKESKQEKYQNELKKEYVDIQSKILLLPYFK